MAHGRHGDALMYAAGELSTPELERWAQVLNEARILRRPVAPLTDAVPSLGVADAYAISERVVAARRAGGARVVGHKIGLTATAVQRQLRVEEPDFGVLLDEMEVADNETIPASAFIAPRIELELAFHLGAPLDGPGVGVDDVSAATAAVQPAMEIVDSRVVDWRITLPDTVADQASSAAFVLGGEPVPLDGLDVGAVELTLHRGAEVVERGRSDAVLGDPRVAVAWLANTLSGFGTKLDPGQVILSGACTRMVDVHAGDRFWGDFGALGTASVGFS